jgi:hypothetical protein
MSLDRKDVRSKISTDSHADLVMLADFHEKDISELSSLYLEKQIAAKTHAFKVYRERMERLGKTGRPGGERAAPAGRSGKPSLRGV